MKMKELEEKSGIGRETIRYYIREGLLPEPDRPKTNVAIYSEHHLRRLTLIRTLQRERFLPLGVIRRLIEQAGDREPDMVPGLFGLDIMLANRLGADTGRSMVDINKVSEDSGMPLAEIREMAAAGIVALAQTSDGKTTLSPHDAALLCAWRNIQALGFTTQKGYGPSYLKKYADLADAMAALEVNAFYDQLADGMDTDTASAMASAAIPQALDVFGQLRTKALLTRIAERNAEAMAVPTTTSNRKRA
ncbi:MerR family transcriptional regulator [Pyruvatibacter sp.]|uniref:MerR family transcriptional regulator n=1 Tax=Pyruvatibacter sp. TaxID=1981328 RepID=UPI0032EB0B29